MHGYIYLGIAILATVLSQLLFKKGISALGNLNFSTGSLMLIAENIFKNPYILVGLFFYGISFILWIFVLTKMKLSIAYPLTSVNFILVLVLSYFIFGEKLIPTQYLGIFLIVIGVILLAKA